MSDSPEPMSNSIIVEEPSELSPLPADVEKAAKKARRQTAIYPNTLRSAPKPFSRSAAKRESVMALGSIEHLQHYFTKTGIAAKQKPNGRMKGLVPAIGGARHIRAASSVTSIPELPPSPMVPTAASSRPPFVHLPKTYEVDPEQLRPGVVRDLKSVEHAWKLGPIPQDDKLTPQPQAGPSSSSSFDVLSTLRVTTHAIRSVRDYVLSLPDDHPTHNGQTAGMYRSPAFLAPTRATPPVPVNSNVPSLASVIQQAVGVGGQSSVSSTPSPRPSLLPTISVHNTGSSSTGPGGQSSQPFPSKPEEPLALVRRAALDVLISLRALEERARIPGAEAEHSTSHSRFSTVSHDGRSASSRSDTPADRVGSPGMFQSGDEAERESATSLSTFSRATRGDLPRLSTTTGVSTDTVLVHGRGAVQVWSDSDDDGDMADEQPEKREVWDERLILGGGWLYRNDLSPEEMLDEATAVKRYLDVVDAVLFHGPGRSGKRGWDKERKKGRRSEVSSGRETPAGVMSDSEDEGSSNRRVSGALSEAMGYLSTVDQSVVIEEGEEDEETGEEGEELPDWAMAEPFGSDLIARTNALLRFFLPASLVSLLPMSPTRDTLLACLSDGQMLCVAYNSAVRKSKKAWGFINSQSIHETAAVSAEDRTTGSLTFRRKENLGLWAAALKLRYVIDIVPAGSNPTHPTRHFHQAPAPETEAITSNQFSPVVIAKRESGWDEMLERAIWEWVNAVVTETKQAAGVA